MDDTCLGYSPVASLVRALASCVAPSFWPLRIYEVGACSRFYRPAWRLLLSPYNMLQVVNADHFRGKGAISMV